MMGKHIIHSTPSNNLPLEENPAIATITITVIKVPELTEQSSRDKPDGIAMLIACT
ncbi:hypothetical protein [Nostoc sp. FACHB-888]|uniref:hypothetical protein n=1 Tax=Nostoc sp. FACHB-888 TaxID=2692842 RepID=UPI001681E634|nr:hypothetical protein [Nostoc sp. FACHB-888]MBD2249642.1 hypothetical protein [Nostoc sp. FACHB-888]